MSINNKINILIVEKNGNIKETQIKIIDEAIKKDFEYDKLYKKCGFKTADNFIKQTEWDITINNLKLNINIYAKKTGRSNLENKYEFPPPIDNVLFFGNVCILAKEYINNDKTSDKNLEFKNDDIIENNTIPYNLTIKDWKLIYDKLYGGFEDLKNDEEEDEMDEEEEEEDELDDDDEEDDEELKKSLKILGVVKQDNYSKNEKKMTKSGYIKNKFIVDDDFIEYDEDNQQEEDIKYIIDKDDYDYNINVIGTELSEEEYIK